MIYYNSFFSRIYEMLISRVKVGVETMGIYSEIMIRCDKIEPAFIRFH